MCLGVSGLVWDEKDLSKGPPHWQDKEQKWQLDGGNNYWLRKISETEPDEISRQHVLNNPVKEFKLTYRYATRSREEALAALCKWLECDLVFGA